MEADFFILGTPNYHGSFSGILKNALDHLNMDYFKMKPVGLIGNSGGIVKFRTIITFKSDYTQFIRYCSSYTNCYT